MEPSISHRDLSKINKSMDPLRRKGKKMKNTPAKTIPKSKDLMSLSGHILICNTSLCGIEDLAGYEHKDTHFQRAESS